MQGIALECVKLAARDVGMTVHEVSTSWLDLPSEAQCYICNALTDIRPVTSVGERNFQRDLRFENVLKTAYESIVCKA
jgi:branched-subunit amino acid aminotransferase/4-amino-4-deoxychorismate lyase